MPLNSPHAGSTGSNLDLINIAGADTGGKRWMISLSTALSFRPVTLSQSLTLEPNTRFAASPPPLPEADTKADMRDAIEQRLAATSCTTETSAFAQPGFECQHNLNYWLFGDYLGIGAGAHAQRS